MHKKSWTHAGLLAVPFVVVGWLGVAPAYAQVTPTLLPPPTPVESAVEPDLDEPTAPVPVQQSAEARDDGARALTAEERRAIAALSTPALSAPVRNVAPTPAVKAPPANLIVRAGINVLFGVSEAHTNRLVVPFRSVLMKTVSNATIEIDKANGLVYIQPNGSEPIGLFLYDEADPVNAISVTLVPADIPPVSVTLHLAGYNPPPPSTQPKVARVGDREVARGWEADQPFTDTLKELLRDLALGRVPSGYSLTNVDAATSGLPNCVMPGLRIEQRQLLTGFNMNAAVARVTNVSATQVDVNETACGGENVVAVAAWPRVRLSPGQTSELFVVVRARAEAAPEDVRPSLIGGVQ